MGPSKKKIAGIFLIMSGAIFLVSCQEYKIEKKANTAVFMAKDTTKEKEENEFYLWEENDDVDLNAIAVNQLGYRKNDKKIAVVPNGQEMECFDVLTEDGKIVYTGQLENSYVDSKYNETLSYADFTPLNSEGTYYIMYGDNIASPIFEIKNNVYENLEQTVISPFIKDILSKDNEQEQVDLDARSKKVAVYDTSEKIEISGGWYTNSDEGRYVVSACTALWNMMYLDQYYQKNVTTYQMGEKKIEINIEKQIKKELNWLFKMQEKEKGGVYHKVTSKTGELDDTELVASKISTCATADFSAIMAKAAAYFKNKDKKMSEKCLNASKKAWRYLKENASNQVFFNQSGIESKEYTDEADADERFWAATELYLVTKQKQYLKEMKKYSDFDRELDFGWKNVNGFAYYDFFVNDKKADDELFMKINEKLQNEVKNSLSSLKKGYLINFNDTKKNYEYIINRAVLLTLMKCQEDKPKKEYALGTKHYLDYLLGTNQKSENVFEETIVNNQEPSIELSSSLLLILQNLT